MAVTKTHPIKSTLKAAIDYICNPEKTDCTFSWEIRELYRTEKSCLEAASGHAQHIWRTIPQQSSHSGIWLSFCRRGAFNAVRWISN